MISRNYNALAFRRLSEVNHVLGIRATLHLRNSGDLTPPIASETIVENTLATSWRVIR